MIERLTESPIPMPCGLVLKNAANSLSASWETKPTPLQPYYVYLSVVVLFCGVIAITALELGAPLGSPLIKLCAVIGLPLLVATTDRLGSIKTALECEASLAEATSFVRSPVMTPFYRLLSNFGRFSLTHDPRFREEFSLCVLQRLSV